MTLLKKETKEPEEAGAGLDALLQKLIADNPKVALELISKLRSSDAAPNEEESKPDPFLNKEFRNFGKAGEKPRAAKITVMDVPGESKWLSLKLGDKPRVTIIRGLPWIVPFEYLSVLDDMVSDTFVHVPLMVPDGRTGNVYETQEVRIVRAPYTMHGEVPWEEYEAFRKKLNQEGGKTA